MISGQYFRHRWLENLSKNATFAMLYVELITNINVMIHKMETRKALVLLICHRTTLDTEKYKNHIYSRIYARI